MTAKTMDIQIYGVKIKMRSFLEEAANVKPSARQLSWYGMEFYAFMHFGINTFTDREWGDGTEDPALFDPAGLDCDQWVSVVKEAGMKGIILTAKHHDGFCLWPSAYTEHSVKNSPCGRDIVKETAEACRRGGIRFGFYLSPWDRNSCLYGTDAYNDYFCNQLEELLTGYGEIFCVWFDNACGEGPNGRRQQYDFPRYINLIRKLQPGAVIFNDYGPDVRWCGNEQGRSRNAEWAVVPSELCRYSEVQTGPGPMADQGDLGFLYNTAENIGGTDLIRYSRGLTFTPAEVDTSIRPGWFWHPQEDPHDADKLFRIYLASVGNGCCLNLNIPPDRSGRIDARDVKALQELRGLLRDAFAAPLPASIVLDENSAPTQPEYHIHTDRPYTAIHYIVLEEDLTKGQRIESFVLGTRNAQNAEGLLIPFYEGTTVGHRKICEFKHLSLPAGHIREDLEGTDLVLKVCSARGPAVLKTVSLY